MRAPLRAAWLAAIFVLTGTVEAKQTEPWASAQELLETVQSELRTKGMSAIGDKAKEMEEALADASKAKALASKRGIVLTDGPTDSLASLLGAAAADVDHEDTDQLQGGSVVAINDPYPLISLYLGSYYNEMQRPVEALRVLDAGIATSSQLGSLRPGLYTERGATLMSMRRFNDSLASYDAGLALDPLEADDKARLLRGRGFALTELNRIDEAEQAYRQSLELEPGNPTALHELEYIAALRRGAKPTGAKPQLTLPNPPGGK